MGNAIFWSNVGIDVQTALAAAKTITAISKASPAVVSAAAHGYANGEYVLLATNGMFELNGVVARVANVTAGTYELEGIDSTTFNSFTSGSSQSVTFGASMTTAQSVNASGGDPEFADTTTIHDTVRKRAPVVSSPMTISMSSIFDPSDPALVEMRKASRALTPRVIRVRFSSGAKMVFNAYVSAPGVPTGQAQGVVQTNISLEAQQLPQVYAN